MNEIANLFAKAINKVRQFPRTTTGIAGGAVGAVGGNVIDDGNARGTIVGTAFGTGAGVAFGAKFNKAITPLVNKVRETVPSMANIALSEKELRMNRIQHAQNAQAHDKRLLNLKKQQKPVDSAIPGVEGFRVVKG
jgi:hypothetical protein